MHLSIDHRRVSFFFTCLIFAVGHDREIILTAKFSRSTVLLEHRAVYSPYKRQAPNAHSILLE